jgi:hypothetical protein
MTLVPTELLEVRSFPNAPGLSLATFEIDGQRRHIRTWHTPFANDTVLFDTATTNLFDESGSINLTYMSPPHIFGDDGLSVSLDEFVQMTLEEQHRALNPQPKRGPTETDE